jgi:hypothetical protein
MSKHKSTTRKSWPAILVFVCALGAARVVRAESASPFPPDSPEAAAVQPTADAREADPDSFRHRIGLQIGGSSYFQIAYRYRLIGGLYVDTGVFALNAGADGSIGGLFDLEVMHPWSLYVGAGVGFGAAFGETTPKGCNDQTTDCPVVHGSVGTVYSYTRVGVAFRFGRGSRHIVGADVGIWRGHSVEETENEVTGRSSFVSPMAGVSYHWAF